MYLVHKAKKSTYLGFSRTSNLRKLRIVLFVNEWILSYFFVILSGDCVYSCSLLRRFAEICVFTNKFPYIRRNIFIAVYKRTKQSPHSERSIRRTVDLAYFSAESFVEYRLKLISVRICMEITGLRNFLDQMRT